MKEFEMEMDVEETENEVEDTEKENSFLDNLNNENLFDENIPGEYVYTERETGKSASGSLKLSDHPHRDLIAQKEAGGEFRREDDDGGHLIGARFEGSSGSENLEAQNSNFNRGAYKRLENQWEKSLEAGDKVFVNVETWNHNEQERPEVFMGYSITEDEVGERHFDLFSYQNESRATMEEWEKEVEEIQAELEELESE